jgi:hypothetical protein
VVGGCGVDGFDDVWVGAGALEFVNVRSKGVGFEGLLVVWANVDGDALDLTPW